MSTNIEWTRGDDGTAGVTWNPVVGCSMKSPGCHHCYAETMSNRLKGMALADITKGLTGDDGRKPYLHVIGDDGRWNHVVTPVPDKLAVPLGWKRPRRVFVNSMSDLFWGDDEDLRRARAFGVKDPQPVPFDFIDKVFAVMAMCPRHTFQILTKRTERKAKYMNHFARAGDVWRAAIEFGHSAALGTEPEVWPLPGVWLGASVEDQKRKTRIDALRTVPAAVRFLSLEPLLEDLGTLDLSGIHWVIVGGESGHGARPCNVEWVRNIIGQCKAAGVPVFVKQLGAWPIATVKEVMAQIGADDDDTDNLDDLELKDSKGGNPEEWPADLNVREFPAPALAARL